MVTFDSLKRAKVLYVNEYSKEMDDIEMVLCEIISIQKFMAAYRN